MQIKHSFESSKPASEDPDVVGSEHWNAPHAITGTQLLGAAMLRSNSWQVNDVLATVDVNGVAITKTDAGTFWVFASGLGSGGVLVQAAPGFECTNGSPYYDSLTIQFRQTSDDALADPTFFSLIAFRN